MIQKISEVLKRIPEGGILKEITDPAEWQRQQRDEWEINWDNNK